MARTDGVMANLKRSAVGLGKVRCIDSHALSGRPKASTRTPVTPALKEFIDNAIVPILVRGYLAMRTAEKEIVETPENVALSRSMTDSPEAEATR